MITHEVTPESPLADLAGSHLKLGDALDILLDAKEENREKLQEQQRRYYEENREKVLEQQRRYREENREKLQEQQRRYREENREKLQEQQRRYYEENREKVLAVQKKWRERNPGYMTEYFRRRNSENLSAVGTEVKA